mmetsp:Transcript_28641/g.66369  ORF Transcript_28641/g.66369 Transcript_28641/m.66369 type:complete len:186 (-) Transcript_28641:64-621(-)
MALACVRFLLAACSMQLAVSVRRNADLDHQDPSLGVLGLSMLQAQERGMEDCKKAAGKVAEVLYADPEYMKAGEKWVAALFGEPMEKCKEKCKEDADPKKCADVCFRHTNLGLAIDRQDFTCNLDHEEFGIETCTTLLADENGNVERESCCIKSCVAPDILEEYTKEMEKGYCSGDEACKLTIST